MYTVQCIIKRWKQGQKESDIGTMYVTDASAACVHGHWYAL